MKKTKLKPLFKEIGVDLETPVSAFLKLQSVGARFLLESVEKGEKLGRYSFIGLNPSAVLTINRNSIKINGRRIPFSEENFSQKLREIFFSFEVEPQTEFPPFIGGWVGVLGYDLVRYLETLPAENPSELNLPEGILYLVKDVFVFDHLKHRATVITLKTQEEGEKRARERIKKIIQAINFPLPPEKGKREKGRTVKPFSNFTRKEFEKIVAQAKEYILAGDIFQVVLSQRFSGETKASPFEIYRRLRMINPSPYMFYFDFNDFQLTGSSPEVLVRLNKKTATIHPIAGTRPRGKTPEEDNKLAEELAQNEKEKAEHVMLVDLARNDLGRVCVPHSIQVTEKMNIEKYSHVMHLVSEVKGKINSSCDALDLFAASFPAGTVTGAPKIRAMEIIEELEKTRRGPYAGGVGYFGLDGNMDVCIAIRMVIYQKGKYILQAGAGIVADSEPEMEYRETLNKMAGLYQAVKIAGEEGDAAPD
ncbi:MAG: anthranilate synthase component I [Candidatus Aminicenantales bacterium]